MKQCSLYWTKSKVYDYIEEEKGDRVYKYKKLSILSYLSFNFFGLLAIVSMLYDNPMLTSIFGVMTILGVIAAGVTQELAGKSQRKKLGNSGF